MEIPTARIFALALLFASSVTHAKNTQREAEILLEQARQTSNIRIDTSPAFRLEARFVADVKSSSVEGTYTEIWISSKRWKKQTVAPGFDRVEILNGTTHWLRDDTPPEAQLLEIEAALDFDFPYSKGWDPASAEDHVVQGVSATCAVMKPDAIGGKSALCFDKSSGLLIEKVIPRMLENRVVDGTCVLSDYQKFAGKIFPRSVKCFLDRKPVLSATLSLVAQSVSDMAPFVPPEGAKPSEDSCAGKTTPPRVTYSPEPPFPHGERNPVRPVVLTLTLGTDGKPLDVSLARSVGRAFDDAAMDTIRAWRFDPATCDGHPIVTKINVEMVFHGSF